MAYIGNPPITGNFQVCDAISVVNGQAAYTMQVSSTNVTPESANHMLVSLNGVLQKPGSSFTISGSTITFASNLATGDVIDFIILLGNVLDLGVPSDATVTNAKTNFVSTSSAAGLQIKGDGTTDGTLQLNCSQNSHGVKLKSPAHSAGQSYTLTLPATAPATDKILQTNSSGVLSFVDAPSGSHTLLSTTTVSSDVSSVDITSNINATYKRYMIDIINLVPSSNAVHLYLRLNDGSSFKSNAGYGYTSIFHGSDDGSSTFGNRRKDSAASQVELANEVGSSTDESLHGRVFLYDPYQASVDYRGSYYMVSSRGDNVTEMMGVFRYDRHQLSVGNEPCSGVQFYMQSGNIASCVIKLYGIS
jgi:hypothetical protein